MKRLLAIFGGTALLSAALVAAAATGAFSGENATNSTKLKSLTSRSGPLGGSDQSKEEIRQRALDAKKAARQDGLLPGEEPLPEEPTPAIIADSPEEPALEEPSFEEEAAGRLSPSAVSVDETEEDAPKSISPERVKEITEKRNANNPYKVVGPKVLRDPRSGTTIIDTSPYND